MEGTGMEAGNISRRARSTLMQMIKSEITEELFGDENKYITDLSQWAKVSNEASFIFRNSYENKSLDGYYFIVAKPFNDKYEMYYDWYKSKKAFKAVLRMCKEPSEYFMTREVLASKAHINLICKSDHDLVTLLHGKDKFRYRYHVVPVLTHIERVIEYIIKESKLREFRIDDDYMFLDC